jgi:hypothetical protein
MTKEKEYSLPEEPEKPKLYPILKDLIDEKSDGKADQDEIEEACDGFIWPHEVEQGLKDLVDMGIVNEETNPQNGEKQYSLPDDKPKVLPIFKDLLKDKKQDKVNKDEIKEACKDDLTPKEIIK